MIPPQSIIDKQTIRKHALTLRAEANANAAEDVFVRIIERFKEGPLAAWRNSKPVIAGYWPFGSEFDTRPLLQALHEHGYDIALPVVHPSDHRLLFRRWTPDLALKEDSMGVMGPPHEADLLEPDILIVPVVAFDDAGHRLGYGKGYYDVTLETLRSRRSILAVGIAYAAQRVPALPHEPHDQKLDWVLTA